MTVQYPDYYTYKYNYLVDEEIFNDNSSNLHI